jgi:hypothetical protein
MGEQSEYLPKALTPMGNMRAIDWLIYRYQNIAHKFIIGTYFHGDLLKAYLKGKYPYLNMEFSEETELVNNARSFSLCMDHADTRYPTLLTFCDLIMLGNYEVKGDMIYVATKDTKGSVGTFRHIVTHFGMFEQQRIPVPVVDTDIQGVVGTFVFNNTAKLKTCIYEGWEENLDITWNICTYYYDLPDSAIIHKVEGLVEFGTQDELIKAREIWEKI